MDNRISKIDGRKPRSLRRSDCPIVALAIVSYYRQQCSVLSGTHRHLPYVRFVGRGLDVSVLGEDWEKILPFVKDGTFNPSQTPTSPFVGYLHPDRHYAQATLDSRDIRFYERVLGVLEQLFPGDYPEAKF